MRGGIDNRPVSVIQDDFLESQRQSLQRRYESIRWRRLVDLLHGGFIALLGLLTIVSLAVVAVVGAVLLIEKVTG